MADDTDDEPGGLPEKVRGLLTKARTHTADWRKTAREDYGYFDGSGQWDEADVAHLREQLRPAITFNRIGPVIDAVIGSELANRQEVRFIPRELGDVQINEILTGAAQWVRDQCDAEDEETGTFLDTLICGIGWTETRMDHEMDPDGSILIERVDPFEMYWDPNSRKQNLSDARWLVRVKRVEKSDIEAMWPDKARQIGGPDATGAADDFEDNVLEHDIAGDDYGSKGGGSAPTTSRSPYRVMEYQWWERESIVRVVDPDSGKILELSAAKFARLKPIAEAMGLPILAVKQTRRRYRRAFLCGDTVLEQGDGPFKDGFTYKAITGKRDRNTNTWFGLVRAMRDPQQWANKWLSQVLHIINTNAKGGLLAETTAFEDVREAERTWAQPDAITYVSPGAISGGKLREKPQVQYPQGLDKLMMFAIASIRDVTGVNLELLGLTDRDQPGIVEYQRKQAGLVILAPLFNALRRYRKEHGRLLLYFIQKYLPDQTLIRINGPNGQQYVPLAKAAETARYDVIVDEAPTSPNQKEKVFAVLSQLLPMILKAGIPVPPEILDYSPLPQGLIEIWKKTLTQGAQQQGVDPAVVEKLKALIEKLTVENQKLRTNGQAQMAKVQTDAQIAVAELQADAAAALAKQRVDATLEARGQDIDARLEIRDQNIDAALTRRRDALDHEAAMAATRRKPQVH